MPGASDTTSADMPSIGGLQTAAAWNGLFKEDNEADSSSEDEDEDDEENGADDEVLPLVWNVLCHR